MIHIRVLAIDQQCVRKGRMSEKHVTMSIELAIHHKRLHPSDSYKSLAEHFQVKKATLYNRIKGTRSAPGINTF